MVDSVIVPTKHYNSLKRSITYLSVLNITTLSLVFAAASIQPVNIPTITINNAKTDNIPRIQKYIESKNAEKVYGALSANIAYNIDKYSTQYKLPILFVTAIAEVESTFYPFALSDKGARGIMQVHPPSNLKLLIKKGIVKNVTELYEPGRNVEAGCYLLRMFLDETGSLDKSLDRYLGMDSAKYKGDVYKNLGRLMLLTQEK